MKTTFVFLLVLLIVPFVQVSDAQANPMTFTVGAEPQRCGDPGCGGWIDAIGAVTASTPTDFETFLARTPYPPQSIRFTSPGGNLLAGLKLGEMIRQHKFNTEAVFCASACAYAFLGGIERSFVDSQSKFGVHRFYHNKAMQNPTLQQFSGVDLDNTQKLMAGLLLYAMKMDIDLRLLSLAAEAGPDEIRWISAQEAHELKIIYKPDHWLPWKIKPAGKGLIAYSETEDKAQYMQLACSASANGASFSLLDKEGDETWFRQCININAEHPILGTTVPPANVSVTRHQNAPVLSFFLGKRQPTYTSSAVFSDTFFYPMACISQFDRYSGTTEGLKQAESHRVLRRLHFLREWSHEQEQQVFP